VTFNLGLTGLGLLIVMSLGFGLIAQVVMWKATTRWLWLIAAAAYFLGGLFTSEIVFGSATSEELQPVIDGLAFDEALLFSLVPGILAVVATWYVTRRGRLHRPLSS
jgi:hypothetical protein